MRDILWAVTVLMLMMALMMIVAGVFGFSFAVAVTALLGAFAALWIIRKPSRDSMRVSGYVCLVLGVAAMLLTMPALVSVNATEYGAAYEVTGQAIYSGPRPATPWSEMISAAVVITFGVLILAVPRPARRLT